jgi:hypothetical protein
MTDERIAAALDAALNRRAGRADMVDSELNLSPHEQTEVDSLLGIADLLWEGSHPCPALDDDPTAAMLGLVPNPVDALDGQAVKRCRQQATLGQSELAARLRERAWPIDPEDVTD